MELYNILILGYYGKPMSEWYFEAFFENTTIDWKDFYLLPHMIPINTKRRPFQCKILNILYMNKIIFKSHFFDYVSQQKKQLFIDLVNGYNHNIYGAKLRSFFQASLVSLMSHRRLPFLADCNLQTLFTDKSLVTNL